MLAAVLLLATVQLPSAALRDTLRATQHAHDAGQVMEVRARWERAAKQAPGTSTPTLALALLDRLRYDYAAAERRAESIIASAGSDRAARMHARMLLAGNAGARWQLKEAEALYLSARSDAMLVRDAISAAEATLRIASVRGRTAGAAAALATLDTAETLAGTDVLTRAAAACVRSQIASSTGDTAAYRLAETGLQLARKAGAARAEGACLQAHGQHLVDRGGLGNSSRALEYFAAAEAIQTRIGDLVGRAAARQWSGYLLLQLGRLAQSRAALEGALADAIRSDNRSVQAWARLNLANLHITLGDDATAHRHLINARASAVAMKERRLQSQILRAQADVSMNREDLPRARVEIAEAFRLSRQLGDTTFHGKALNLRVRMARLSRQKDSTMQLLAQSDSMAARGGTPGFIPALARAAVMLEQDRLDEADSVLRTMPVSASAQVSYVRRARLAEVAARRGDLTNAAVQLTMAIDSLEVFRGRLREPDLRLQVQQLRTLDQIDPDLGVATVLSRLASGGRTAEAFTLASRLRSHELREVMVRRRALETAAAELPGRSGSVDHDPATVQAALRPDEALIFLISGRHREPTTAWIVTASTLASVQLPMADALEPLVRRFSDLLMTGQPSDGLARRLGRELLAPIAAALPRGITQLIIAPDKPVLSLPFDALVLPDGGLALERYTISLVPAPSIFVALRRTAGRERRGGGVLAIAQPMQGEHGAWQRLPPLPWAAREADAIVRAASASQAMIGPAVQMAAVRTASRGNFSVLHLAAHAVVDEQVPARSAILLEPSAGAAGELRLGEVESMQLSAQLVVLSACRTVRGRAVQGEGLRSLGTAFLQAGAQSVVGTAWDVVDARIAGTMSRFYAELLKGRDVGAALSTVKRELRRSGRPSSEWAVLQLLGDPRVKPLGHAPRKPAE